MNRPPGPARPPCHRHPTAARLQAPGWRWLAAAAALAALAGLGACGTAPAPQLYSLLPGATSPVTDTAATTAPGGVPSPARVPMPMPMPMQAPASGGPGALPPLAVAVGPVVVPVPVDQPQWLLQLPDQRLILLEQALWASPLRDELRAALRELLARRWAITDGQPPVWRLTLVLSRFESALGQEARLAGRWTLQPSAAASAAGATPLSCPLLIREPAGAGLPGLADAHRRALARLAAQIGAARRQPPTATGPACPAPDA